MSPGDTLTVGSLFSGIGGLELGLERAGMRTAWQVECDPYALRILARHWPNVVRRFDVTRVHGAVVHAGQCPDCLPPVDVICGGFPCQDLSVAGTQEGIDGARSGLWREFARLVREIRPRFVVVENVPALRWSGLGRVLSDLSSSGYDAEWDCVPASAVGAPHLRDRLFILAHARLSGREEHGGSSAVRTEQPDAECSCGASSALGGASARTELARTADAGFSHWGLEPDVGRMADGIPRRVDRLRVLGNAVVPVVSEFLGRRVVAMAGGVR